MQAVYIIRKGIRDFFSRYDLIIVPALKFLLSFLVFVLINRNFSYMELLNSVFILLVLSLLCAILPLNATVIIGTILILLHCFAADLFIGLTALCLLLLLLILLLRFVPGDTLAVILTPFAFFLNIPAVIPIGLGMLRGASSVFAGIAGVIAACFLSDLPDVASKASRGTIEKLEIIQTMIDKLLSHQELILSMIVFSAVILIVNLIRRMLTKFTYLVAVLAGVCFYLFLRVIGSIFLEYDLDMGREAIGLILAALICLVIAFFVHCADYKRTKLLQFEDDEYYYYVKAVPKRLPEAPEQEPVRRKERSKKRPDLTYDVPPAAAQQYEPPAQEQAAPPRPKYYEPPVQEPVVSPEPQYYETAAGEQYISPEPQERTEYRPEDLQFDEPSPDDAAWQELNGPSLDEFILEERLPEGEERFSTRRIN